MTQGIRNERPLHDFARAFAVIAVLLAIAWVAGFAWFVRGSLREGTPNASADGIVVLTGGADRVATGLRLLNEGRARVLLISGVGHGAGLAEIIRHAGLEFEDGADREAPARITLGRSATTTIGNADETAAWAADNHLHSLLVVTAGYHMQRALREIGRAAPNLTLYPEPVMPPALRSGTYPSTLRLLANEYDKWLISTLGLTRLESG